jgi:carbonic anhydrase
MHPTRFLIAPLVLAAFVGCAERHETPVSKPAAEPAAEAAEPAKTEAAKPAAHKTTSGPSPLEAIARLSAGNARFASGRRSRSADATDDGEERTLTAKGQHPFAAVLTCSDSRVPPELLFDQSLGDIFVVRNAGNVAEPVGEAGVACLLYTSPSPRDH